jgi:hypothetical protein
VLIVDTVSYPSTLTSLIPVTAQNWFERNPSRYCYVASCDEKTYGCFNSANRTKLRLLAQQHLDPEDIDDLEEYEETRKRRGGFEVVDIGKLLVPKVWGGGGLEVVSAASGEREVEAHEEAVDDEDINDQASDDSLVTITATKPSALTRTPRPISGMSAIRSTAGSILMNNRCVYRRR